MFNNHNVQHILLTVSLTFPMLLTRRIRFLISTLTLADHFFSSHVQSICLTGQKYHKDTQNVGREGLKTYLNVHHVRKNIQIESFDLLLGDSKRQTVFSL